MADGNGKGYANFKSDTADGDDDDTGEVTVGACATGGAMASYMPLDPFNGQMMSPQTGKCGPCFPDASWRALETALVPRRYATFFLTITRTVAGQLQIPLSGAANELIVFAEGVSESGQKSGFLPAGTELTRAETDGFTKGALASDKQFGFRVVGMGVQIERPYRGVTINGDVGARADDIFWDASYTERLVGQLLKASHITYKQGNASGGFEMGLLKFHPSMSAVEGAGVPRVGVPVAGGFVPLRIPVFGGGPDDDNQLNIVLTVDRTVSVEPDPLVPVPALGVGEFYSLPITVELIGHTVRLYQEVTKSAVKREARKQARAAIEELFSEMPDNATVADMKRLVRNRK